MDNTERLFLDRIALERNITLRKAGVNEFGSALHGLRLKRGEEKGVPRFLLGYSFLNVAEYDAVAVANHVEFIATLLKSNNSPVAKFLRLDDGGHSGGS